MFYYQKFKETIEYLKNCSNVIFIKSDKRNNKYNNWQVKYYDKNYGEQVLFFDDMNRYMDDYNKLDNLTFVKKIDGFDCEMEIYEFNKKSCLQID